MHSNNLFTFWCWSVRLFICWKMLHVLQIFDYFLSFCASLEEVAWRLVSDNFDIDVVQYFLKEKDSDTNGISRCGVIEVTSNHFQLISTALTPVASGCQWKKIKFHKYYLPFLWIKLTSFEYKLTICASKFFVILQAVP